MFYGRFMHSFLEFTALVKGKQLDINGLLILSLTLILILTGIFLAPIMVLAGLDPFTQIARKYYLTLNTGSLRDYVVILLCFVLTQWCTLELSRIYITASIPTMTMFNMYLHILQNIMSRPLNQRTLFLYQQLQLINKAGANMIATVAGAFLGIGFFIFVLGNWIIVAGLSLIPFDLYLILNGIILIAYFILFQTVPSAIKCNEVSSKIIRKWKHKILQVGWVKYWKKKIEAQQNISIPYALTTFEKDTQINYYASIVIYTVNALILF